MKKINLMLMPPSFAEHPCGAAAIICQYLHFWVNVTQPLSGRFAASVTYCFLPLSQSEPSTRMSENNPSAKDAL